MFVQENFTFNGIYSKDMNVAIATFDTDLFSDIGIEYTSDISIENGLVRYNPYYVENFSEPRDIELNLVMYNPITMEAIDVGSMDMERITDWLCTENFAPFISDDDKSLIYYFKVVNLQKVLTFNNKGYLRVTFKPYSRYAYKREVYDINVIGGSVIEILNCSREMYYPLIEVTNLGDVSTVNKINNMEIIELEQYEKVIIDNLVKIVQTEDKVNKFNCCNRKWIKMSPRAKTQFNFSGNMQVRIICEFPILR